MFFSLWCYCSSCCAGRIQSLRKCLQFWNNLPLLVMLKLSNSSKIFLMPSLLFWIQTRTLMRFHLYFIFSDFDIFFFFLSVFFLLLFFFWPFFFFFMGGLLFVLYFIFIYLFIYLFIFFFFFVVVSLLRAWTVSCSLLWYILSKRLRINVSITSGRCWTLTSISYEQIKKKKKKKKKNENKKNKKKCWKERKTKR